MIIDADNGYGFTNSHVVENGERIIPPLKDRRKFGNELIGSDPGTDIALLKIKADDLMAFDPDDSDRLQVGDYVLVIGQLIGINTAIIAPLPPELPLIWKV